MRNEKEIFCTLRFKVIEASTCAKIFFHLQNIFEKTLSFVLSRKVRKVRIKVTFLSSYHFKWNVQSGTNICYDLALRAMSAVTINYDQTKTKNRASTIRKHLMSIQPDNCQSAWKLQELVHDNPHNDANRALYSGKSANLPSAFPFNVYDDT